MVKKRKTKSNTYNKIILGLNILFSALLLLSYLAPSTDPRDFALIALLGFGYQILVLVNISFVIFWLFRFKPYALISAVCILLGFNIILSNFGYHFFSPANKVKSNGAIRIMAFNVNGFNGTEKFENETSPGKIAELINKIQPDIVDMEEFNEYKPDSGAKVRLIENALKPCYHFYKRFSELNRYSSIYGGNAIFTKFPVIDTGSVGSPGFLDVRAIYVDVKCQGKIFRIYCIHLAAVNVGANKDAYLNGQFIISKFLFIEDRLKDAFVKRSYQVSRIKEHMAQCPYPYIVAGDFNDTPISYAVNELSNGLKNAFIEKGCGLGTTYYSSFPKLHIDYILTSPQFDVLNYQEIDKRLSDHMPIISVLKLN